MRTKALPSPLLIPALFWCLGIFAARLASPPFWLMAGSACLLGLGAVFIRNWRGWLLLLLCFSLGGLRLETAQRPTQLDLVFQKQNHIQQEAEFWVSALISRDAQLYEIKLSELAGVEVREPLILYSESPLEPGHSYTALLEVIPGKRDPLLDTIPSRHRAYIRQSLKEIPGHRRFLPIASWRARLLAGLDAKLGADADFAKALLFSDTSAKGIYRDQLTRSGMIHLIVVSGLHIWFIYAMCMILFNALLPRRLAEGAFLILILVYSALNHWSPSVVRSVLMIGLYIFARWRSIPLGGPQLLALSLLVITAADPAQLFDIGLQLSYLCIGVIILALPKIAWIKESQLPSDAVRHRINKTLDLLLLNVAVGVAILPVTLYYFGTASLNGILGNLLGIPLSGAILALCALILVLPGGNFVSAAFVASYRLALRIFLGWTAFVSKLPFYLENAWLSRWQLLGSLILVLCAMYCLRQWKLRWKVLPAAALGAALLVVPPLFRSDPGGIYVFNCGTGDCILARFADQTKLMVDTGPLFREAEKSWAARKLLPWLKRRGVNRLDWLVLTHLDSDHSGGFVDIAKTLKVKNLIVSDETMRDQKWEAWRDSGMLKGAQVHCVSDTVTFAAGGARLKFLHPDKEYFSETANSTSLVFRLDYAGRSYLFTGDADLEAEAHLLANYASELKADYLKAGHHGSRSSSSREFVRAVRPTEVWITASDRNPWGFPHPEPLAAFRLYARGVRSTSNGSIYLPFEQKD